jgi:hypothetical protein
LFLYDFVRQFCQVVRLGASVPRLPRCCIFLLALKTLQHHEREDREPYWRLKGLANRCHVRSPEDILSGKSVSLEYETAGVAAKIPDSRTDDMADDSTVNKRRLQNRYSQRRFRKSNLSFESTERLSLSRRAKQDLALSKCLFAQSCSTNPSCLITAIDAEH